MLREIRPAIVMLVALTLITGLVYPLAMTGIAQVIFPSQAQGSLIERDGKVVGSELIGQAFTSDTLFPRPAVGDARARSQRRRPRPSPAPYNAANSGGLEPRPDQQGADRPRQGRRRQAQAGEPRRRRCRRSGDHVGSGLDPDISPEAALFPGAARGQGARLARRSTCAQLVDEHIEGRLLGILGEPRVNVLALNLALDRRRPMSSRQLDEP